MIINNQSNVDYSYVLPDGTVVTGNQPSNIVQTEVISDLFTKVKTGDKVFLRGGESSVHTVVLTNNSSTTILNPFFSDTMTAGASYVAGSVTVNGVSQPSYDPAAGFALADMIIADNPITSQSVDDNGNVGYSINDPISGTRTFQDTTNTVTVVMISGEIIVFKSADRAYAVRGDTVHYTSTVTNTGNINETSLVFRDPIPAGTSFVANSVKINGVNQPGLDPAVGFSIPDLAPGASNTVEFDVTVN